MANSAQSRKRARQAETRRTHNAGFGAMMRTYIKRTHQAIDKGDAKQAQDAFRKAESVISKVAGKNIIHKGTAARYKMRLAAQVKKLSVASSD